MVSPPYYRLVDSSEDGGGGTAEGFAADDAALGIADHAAGVKDIGAGRNAGGDKSTNNVNRIGHGVWQVFDIAIVRVGDGDGCTGSGGEFAVGDGFNIDAGNHAEGLDGGGANVDFVRGEVENLGRHGAVLPFMLRSFVAFRIRFLNLQFVHKICYDDRIYADFDLKSLVETEK
jgi:hypothetical protein